MRASIGMKWFRSNIRHGSRLALFALAVQFALSFGHFHGGAAQAAAAVQSGSANSLSAADTASEDAQQQPSSNHDSDQQQGDVCAICAVLALANTMLFATPPLLLLPQAIEILYLSTDAEFAHLNSARVAFQPRAPPVS
jgi:predicted lysophospholipase L1 biosynthesis ABC-type transport system permease subunit